MKSKMRMGFAGRKAAPANGFAWLAVFLCMLGLSLPAAAAASKAGRAKQPAGAEGTSIPLPAAAKEKARSSFSGIKPRILDLIEDGSPRSLEIASRLLHRSSPDAYSDDEKILLQVCSLIMETCWPSSRVSWTAPDITASGYYANVLFSVRNGIYDEPVGNEFIAAILPCLCLFTAPKETEFYGSAERALSKALAQKGGSTLANYLMGCLLSRQGKNGKAAAHLRKAVANDAANKDILALQMRVCTALSQFDEALAIGDRLLSADPQNLAALELYCDALYFKGDMAGAGDLAARILVLDSKNYKYILVRAEASMQSGDYVKSSALLDAYARGGQAGKRYYLLRSRLQSEWNKSDAAAAETLGQALLAYPDDGDLLLAAAKVASHANMKLAGKTALDFARRVLAKDSENAEAVEICIAELAKEESFEEAYRLSAAALKGGRTDGLVHTHIGICLSLGKFEEALQLATELYNKDRSDSSAQKSYVKVLVSTGRKAEAQEMIAALLADADASMKSFLYYEQSFLYTDDKSVVAQLRSSLTQNPRNTDALTRLYELYYSKQDWKKAQYYLKQVVALNPSNKKALAMSQKLDKIINN